MAHGPKSRWTDFRRRTIVDVHPGRRVPVVGASRARPLLARDVSDSTSTTLEYLSSLWGAPTAYAVGTSGRGAVDNQFIGTLEYTYVVQPVRAFTVKGLNLYGGLQLVGFADVGRAWGSDSAQESESAIRLATVVGRCSTSAPWCQYVDVIRLDVAWRRSRALIHLGATGSTSP